MRQKAVRKVLVKLHYGYNTLYRESGCPLHENILKLPRRNGKRLSKVLPLRKVPLISRSFEVFKWISRNHSIAAITVFDRGIKRRFDKEF